ncbi:FAD/NAD(P)-binding domain-containing protein [Ceratobasidium sp. AG-I]|nr:FAD/NAD(P)-binding domain-containing protein [Ceratobasidium sp. AG-I]
MIFPSALLFGLTQLSDVVSASKSVKVAVIGAGAGGSSASYWLSLAKQRAAVGTDVSVTVYEKDTRVGGRSTTVYPYDDTSYAPIELGASIFTSSNKNMMRAASTLGLDLVQFTAVAPGTGIWDGKQFVWRTTDNSTADNIRMAERYQDGPVVSGGLIGQFSANFSKSYTPTLPQWKNISSYAASLGYTPLETLTLQDYLDNNGVNKLWTREFMSGSSRFNYGQDADAIQGVAGMASLAASSAYSAKPGNFKIFEGLLKNSGATLKLGSEVTSVTKIANKYVITTKNSIVTYDAVIIAAPLPLTNIKFLNLPKPSTFPKVDYLHLHVTLLTTTTPSLLPGYFKLNDTLALPGTVLTTAESGIQPEFNSIRYQAAIQKNGATEYVVKMFSKTKISDETLAILFGKGKVGWLLRKEWDAYPYFPKRTDFPPVKIDNGLYYVNAMEGLWSTMETETISSRNVVDLLSTEIFGSGLCGPAGAKGPVTDSYVVGWDC